MQQIIFPMKSLNITQGIGGKGTHAGSNAIDIAGRDTGIDDVLAPFTGVVKKIYRDGNTVWLESVEPVLFADGTVDFATAYFTHDNDVNDLWVGKRIEQGQTFYQEGTAGNATGNHVHLEIARGRFSGSGWYQNPMGYWVLPNSVPPWNAFFLSGTEVINGYGYPWKEAYVKDKITREQLEWHYKTIGGYVASKAELDGWMARQDAEDLSYKQITEEMKTYWDWRNASYLKYYTRAEARMKEQDEIIKKLQAEFVSPGEAESKLKTIRDAIKFALETK